MRYGVSNYGESAMVPVELLACHPANPRQGDVGAVAESIKAHGFYGALVVQRSSGYILAGNHRFRAAVQLGLRELPVLYVDVDDEQAKRIMLADNRTSDMGVYDDAALHELLQELVASDDGLMGTGYSDDDLQKLLDEANKPLNLESFRVSVTCETAEQQREAMQALKAMGLEPKAV